MSKALAIFAQLRSQLDASELRSLRLAVRAHFERLQAARRESELVAIDLAQLLCERLEALLDMAPLLGAEAHCHVVGAARYFVSSEDAVADYRSCTGLDDDVAVFNHVVGLLGRKDLEINE